MENIAKPRDESKMKLQYEFNIPNDSYNHGKHDNIFC